MTGIALCVEECCSWCRRPVSGCSEPSCDDAQIYSGVLLRGEWKELDEEQAPVPAGRQQ